MGQIACCCVHLGQAVQDIEKSRMDAHATYLLHVLFANHKFLYNTPHNPLKKCTNMAYFNYVASLAYTLEKQETTYLSDMAFLKKPTCHILQYIKKHYSSQDVVDMAFAMLIGEVSIIKKKYACAQVDLSIPNPSSLQKTRELLHSNMQHEIQSVYNDFEVMLGQYCNSISKLCVSNPLFVAF